MPLGTTIRARVSVQHHHEQHHARSLTCLLAPNSPRLKDFYVIGCIPRVVLKRGTN